MGHPLQSRFSHVVQFMTLTCTYHIYNDIYIRHGPRTLWTVMSFPHVTNRKDCIYGIQLQFMSYARHIIMEGKGVGREEWYWVSLYEAREQICLGGWNELGNEGISWEVFIPFRIRVQFQVHIVFTGWPWFIRIAKNVAFLLELTVFSIKSKLKFCIILQIICCWKKHFEERTTWILYSTLIYFNNKPWYLMALCLLTLHSLEV